MLLTMKFQAVVLDVYNNCSLYIQYFSASTLRRYFGGKDESVYFFPAEGRVNVRFLFLGALLSRAPYF